jgi:hypothetical protein
MRSFSELLDMQSRGEDISPDANNKLTQRRKAWKAAIIEQAGNDGQTAYDMSLDILGNYVTRLQQFVLEHSEEPAPRLPDLAKQVYQLRMQDVKEVSEVLDYDNEQGVVHLEDQENLFEDENGYRMDGFLGELFAPIEIVYTQENKGESFIASDIANTLIPAIGNKVNKATLIRAAQGKPSGVLGFLSTGGKKHYEALVSYFRANPETAKKVLAGQITDESQLPNWTVPAQQGNPLTPLADDLRKDQLKKMLPYIIGFLVILGLIVYFAARNRK